MNKLPESPRKIVAGLKLKRRNPRIAPARTMAISSTRFGPCSRATTNTTIVEKRADPAARPSSPSIKLKALVIAKNPSDGEEQSDKPGQRTIAENNRNVDDPQAAGIKHRGGNSLHREFHVRTDSAEIVINTEKKNQRCRDQDGDQRPQEMGRMQSGMELNPDRSQAHAD